MLKEIMLLGACIGVAIGVTLVMVKPANPEGSTTKTSSSVHSEKPEQP
jgi:hypothetical protein